MQKSYVYKLTSAGILPYSKAGGVDVIKNANSSDEEKQVEAATYINTHQ